MPNWKRDFIVFAINCGVLKFGAFKLKSGRMSPYFFNTGFFNNGNALAQLGYYYALALLDSGLKADILYGPAYKGIPLVVATSIALTKHDINIPFSFNRKEEKSHGEGGALVGAQLIGNAVILDDVITSGSSIRESFEIIHKEGAKPIGVIISLDRQEKGVGEKGAVQEVMDTFNIPVVPIITLENIIEYLETTDDAAMVESIKEYQKLYGVFSR